MKKILAIILLTLLVTALKPQTVSADCSQIYGGGENCTTSYSFSLEKFVLKPGKGGGNFVNSMSINDPRYSPKQNVSFQIVVKNTGSQTIPNVSVVDSFPNLLSFVSGPGNFDNSTKKLSFNIVNLAAGQNVKYTVTGKLADSNLMPNEGMFCLSNQVTGTDDSGDINSASSQFCVEKPVLGVKTPQVLPAPKVTKTPATGPEMLPLLALLPGGLAGFILRRKSNGSHLQGGEK